MDHYEHNLCVALGQQPNDIFFLKNRYFVTFDLYYDLDIALAYFKLQL